MLNTKDRDRSDENSSRLASLTNILNDIHWINHTNLLSLNNGYKL